MRGVALALALVLPGCVAELIVDAPVTTRQFACHVLHGRDLDVVVHFAPGAQEAAPAALAVQVLQWQLERLFGNAIVVQEREASVDGGEAGLEAWARGLETQVRGGMRFHVLWALAPEAPDPSGGLVVPAVVVVAAGEVRQAAARLGRDPGEVAAAVLLHHAGHALGVVNNGIPIVDLDVEKREDPPKHDPSRDSVMHASWHQAATMTWNATLAYPDGTVRDWDAATGPGGACT